jgi:hypothetical protein
MLGKLSLIQSSHLSKLRRHEGYRSIVEAHINTLVVFLNIRSKSSHSDLENGTTLSAPDIKLSVCGISSHENSEHGCKVLSTHIVPRQSFDYILQGQSRWENVRGMETKIIPITTTMTIDCNLFISLNITKCRYCHARVRTSGSSLRTSFSSNEARHRS